MSAACTTGNRLHSGPPAHRSQTHRQSWIGMQHPGALAFGCARHSSLCVSSFLFIPQAERFRVSIGFLKCNPAFQQPIRYNLAILGDVLKHIYITECS
jgi:hypothetical protein